MLICDIEDRKIGNDKRKHQTAFKIERPTAYVI